MNTGDDESLSLEVMWAGILSRNTPLILAIWKALNQEDQHNIWRHLRRMAHEEGWAEQQRVSAQYALDALHENQLEPCRTKRRQRG